MEKLVVCEWTQKLIDQNKKYQPIGQLKIDGSPIFLVEERKSDDFDIQIVKIQSTKTQQTFCVQVPNYFAGRRHNLRLPLRSLKRCKEFVDEVFENGHAQHWTGYIIATTVKFFNDRR